MPWLEERTLTLFVRDTEVRRYEPGVRERGVDVERPSGPLMGSADTDTDPDRALSLKAPVIHGHLIRQHFFRVVYRHSSPLIDLSSIYQSRLSMVCALFTRAHKLLVRESKLAAHGAVARSAHPRHDRACPNAVGSLTLNDRSASGIPSNRPRIRLESAATDGSAAS